MLQGFRDWLIKQNIVALALAVVIGTALGKVVSAFVADVIMPLVGVALPGGSWRTVRVVLERSTVDGKVVENALLLGDLLGALLDFVIIAGVVYLITKVFIKSPPPPDTRSCPKCLETIPTAATRCRYCTAELGPARSDTESMA